MANLVNLKNFLNVAISKPTGVWEQIIMAFHNGIPNYAWAIIVFTFVLKIALLPLDFFNRRMTVKNTKVQALVQPEIEKIQKKYGNNKQIINQKTMEIYKKYNYNVTGSCVLMLVYMALTLFIFITLFSGLNSMAGYKVGYQFQEIEKTYDLAVEETGYDIYLNAYNKKRDEIYNGEYTSAYNEKKEQLIAEKGSSDLTPEELETISNYAKQKAQEKINQQESINQMIDAGTVATGGKTEEQFLNEINLKVKETYNNVKDSWLWIDNVWKSDVPWTNSITSYDEFISLAKITYVSELKEGQEETFNLRLESNKDADKLKYETVISAIESENRVNGYMIIPILAVIINVLSMLATQGKLKFKKKIKNETESKNPKAPGGILMLVLIPGLMFYITLTYNAVFGLYILISSLFGLVTTPLINYGIKKFDNLLERKKNKKEDQPSYKR